MLFGFVYGSALAKMRDVATNIFLGRELTRNVLGVAAHPRDGSQEHRLLVHTVADSPQRPRQDAVRHEFAPLIMFRAITVQCCAAGQSVGDGVERYSATGDERRIIAQHGLAFAESRQRIDPVPR